MGHQVLGVGLTGTVLTELERRILRESPPYAVILFGRNVASVEQLRALVRDIKSQSETPPVVMIDEEGGRVDRLRVLLGGMPSAEAFSEGKDGEYLAGWFGRIIGQALRYFDMDVNLAPVTDLRRDVAARGLERRCFGTDAATVITLAGAFMRGLHDAGVASCLKHFPGIGAGSGDSHYEPSVVDLGPEELRANDLAPYEALATEARGVLIGHAVYPQLEDPAVPASLSRRIATGLLRDELGFDGVAISDDMEMHAVSDLAPYTVICERALCAGNDVILLCSHVEMVPEIMQHLERRASEDPAIGIRFEEAMRRSEEYRGHARRLRDAAVVRTESFEEILEEVARFRQAFDEARPEAVEGQAGRDRRQTPRTPGTGKTGREEWT